MSKELEAFYCILNKDYTDDEMYKRAVNNVEKALIELEQINNSKPSKALECLEEIEENIIIAYDDDFISYDYTKELDTIKQALTSKSDKELVLDKIKEIMREWNDNKITDMKALQKIDEVLEDE